MQVAVDATPLLGARTGVGQFVAALLRSLPEVDGAPQVVPYALSSRARRDPAGLPPGTRVAPLPARVLLEAWARGDRPRASRWLAGVDVVHGTNFVVPPVPGVPEVVTVHDCWCARNPGDCPGAVRPFSAAVRRAVRRGAWVHVGTSHVAAEVREVYGAERVVVVPFGVDAPDAADVGPPPPAVAGHPYLLALGAMDARKNLDGLVRAFAAPEGPAAAHPGMLLVLAGPDGPARLAVERVRDELPAALRERVVLLGRVDDDTRWALLAGAAALAYPSRYEGFGLPVLEAMAVGTPVVATAVGALPEVAGEGAILVDPLDREALASALADVVGDVALRAELIGRGRAVAAGYPWRATAEGLARAWRDLAEGREPSDWLPGSPT